MTLWVVKETRGHQTQVTAFCLINCNLTLLNQHLFFSFLALLVLQTESIISINDGDFLVVPCPWRRGFSPFSSPSLTSLSSPHPSCLCARVPQPSSCGRPPQRMPADTRARQKDLRAGTQGLPDHRAGRREIREKGLWVPSTGGAGNRGRAGVRPSWAPAQTRHPVWATLPV